jgi:magnesium transporter
VIVDCGHYIDGVRQHDEAISLAQAAHCRAQEEGFVWVGIADPEPAELDRLASELGLHELAVEDARKAHQRPKIEGYDEHTFVVLRTAHYIDEEERVEFGEIHVFIGSGYVVTVRHGEGSALRRVRETLEARPDLLSHGPVTVLWGVLDCVVDDYEPVVTGLDDDIAEVEESVFQPARDRHHDDATQRIYFLRREVVDFYRAVHPLIAPLEAAVDNPRTAPMRDYLRDVADHARRVQDEVIAQREQLQSVLDASVALVTRRQSETVQTISAWAAIIAVPTLIASVYGMNFQNMPELGWGAGYPLALGAMLLSGLVLYGVFKRARWL